MNVHMLNTLECGQDLIRALGPSFPIQGVIGLTERDPGDGISGYMHQRAFCEERGIPFIEVEDYGLRSPGDRVRIEALDLDVLIVAGWQRLVPDWLIGRCRGRVLGAHGSPWGITGGRGRSPQNWALILGRKEFFISLFLIDAGIDSGRVVQTRSFPLTPADDVKTSYYKTVLLEAEMLRDFIRDGCQVSGARPQEGVPRYLPQRVPEDGEIDWSRPAQALYDFVRALTRPYPGAFSRLGTGRLVIHRTRVLDLDLEFPGAVPGQIVQHFTSGDLLVRTGQGLLLLEDYRCEPEQARDLLAPGLVLPSVDFADQIQGIVRRHLAQHPGLPVPEELLGKG